MAEGFGFSLEKGAERTHVLKQTPMKPVDMSNRWMNSNQLNKDEIINPFQDEVYKLVQNNHSIQRNNEYLETQHEQDLYHAESLKDQLHQLQYDNSLLYDVIERQKRDFLSDNDKLIQENKTLIFERDDLRKQRDELTKKLNGDEQTKNNYLNTKKTCVVGHTNCERQVTFYKNKATIVDKQCRHLLEENSQLKNQTVELRKEKNAIQTRYEKKFSRDVPVTSTNRGKNGSTHSPKLTGKGRPPKQSEKTTTSEDDNSTIAYHKECCKWKLKNEHLNTRIEELENKLLTNNHQLRSFENEVQNLKYTVSNNETANSKLKNEQRELHALRDTIRKQQTRIELLDDEKDKLEQERKMITRHSTKLKIQNLEQRIEQSADQLRVAEEKLNIERSRNIKLLKKMVPYERTVEKLRVMTKTYESERSRNHMLSNEKAKCERTVDKFREVNQELESQISMSVKKDKFEEIVEKLRVLNGNLKYEMSQNDMLSKEINKYKEQIEHMADYHAHLRQEDKNSKYLQITTEKNQQLERQLSSIKQSEQVLDEKIDSRNNEIRELRNDLECKDRDISKLQIELQRQYQEIDKRVSELAVIKETNLI
ncbi:hypothetical protein MAR_024003 [Mya arenaria]|uniref:Uncharacterized protein n=1 Tax=Mya arenaria TaxID=6604 RepID=A0ABY7DSH6_MYAAR|nr:hypothetical protein MAR_024003 [Mya arenaria]